ncbi:MAG TPA: FG-GAP-like repeat-containing protein [Gemmataceae bacterium]|nr:FG-GAP-like repeat-containing protein [Gemmataceae bacterium]
MTRAARLRVEPLEDRATPAAGQLDPSFGSGGTVVLQGFNASAVDQSIGGGFVAAESSTNGNFRVGRFTPGGAPDPTFGTGGVVSINGNLFSPVITDLPDSGVLVGWVSGTLFSEQISVARFTSTGALDTAFGTGGIAVFGAVGHYDSLAGIVVQPDGRIVVVGSQMHVSSVNGVDTDAGEMVVTRLTSAGQLDSGFGQGGTSTGSFPVGQFSNASAGGFALQPDGRIVVGGKAVVSGQLVPNGTTQSWSTNTAPVAVRLTADGQLDGSFGSGGRVVVSVPGAVGSSTRFDAVGVLPDGRLVFAGVAFTDAAQFGVAARLTTAGQLDPSYGTGGVATTTPIPVSSATFQEFNAAIDSSGRALISSARYITHGQFSDGTTLYRLTAAGTADGGFGSGGQVAVSQSSDLQQTLFTQPNGDIVMGRGSLLVRVLGSNPPAGFVSPTAGAFTAGGAADGTVQVLNPTNGTYAAAGTVAVYPGAAVGVRGTTADVNGDGTPDLIHAAGPGGGPEVTVIDGKTGARVASFLAFEPTFTGGVFVAAADLDADGKPEIVVTPDQGGGPRVVVFSVVPGGAVTQRTSFFGFDDANFRGGARIAAGDVNNDGTPDLAVAAGFLGGPRVALLNGKTVLGTPAKLIGDFFAFPGTDAVNLRNGVYVAAGDVDGDGFADLTFGGGPGGAPRVFTLSGALLTTRGPDAAQASPLSNFFVGGSTTDRGGVTVAATTQTDDTRATVAVGSGQGSAGRVRVYRGTDITSAAEPTAFQDVTVFGGAAVPGGVFVG